MLPSTPVLPVRAPYGLTLAVECQIGGNMMPRWACTASSLPKDTELGSVHVSCEGYTYRDDPYVLKGSCAMEYTLTAPTPQ